MKNHTPSPTPPEQRLRNHRLGKQAGEHILNILDAKRSPWAETAQEIEAGLRQGKENDRLLAWVRSQMLLQLSETEQQCITLYYFRALNSRQAGTLLHMNPSSVYRAVRRGIRKLKKAAQQSGIGRDTRRGIQKPRL